MATFLRPVLTLAKVLFALFLIYFALRTANYHFHLVTFPFPVSFREGAMMTSTDALIKGLNPYDMSLQPQFMNQYGIIYPLFVWPWAKFFGTTILVHRTVTAVFILASCVFTFMVLKRLNISILLNVWAVLMLYASLLYPGTSTPTIDPASTGMLFLLLTIFLPWFDKFSYRSLVISVLCGVLAFYTKLYFFLGAIVILSYLFLFVSRIKSLFYGVLLTVLLAASIFIVNQILPAYFDNCFFAAINMAPAWSSMQRLNEQIALYSHLHKATFILIGLFILGYALKKLQNIHSFSPLDIMKKLHLPLILYAGLFSGFVLYMKLGRHGGAMLWYFFQLLSPFFLIAAVWIFNRFSLWPVLCVPFLVYNLFVLTEGLDYKQFDKNLPGWPDISLLVSQHQHILNSSLIAPLLIEQNKEVSDNGQTEYFGTGAERSSWTKLFFKEDSRVYYQLIMFFDDIKSKVENREYDLIILQPSLLPSGVADDVRKFYKCEGQLLLYAPQDRRPYPLTVWLPIK